MSYEFFQNSTRLAGVLNKSNNSNESNKSYTLRGALLISSMIGCARHSIQACLHALLSLAQSVSDGANTPTVSTVVVVRVVAAATEEQVTSASGARRTERTRPVVAVHTHEEPISTAAPASSREEDTVAVDFTGYKITLVPALGCPSPIAFIFITEFFKLFIGRHAPTAAPVLTGSVVATGGGDTCLTAKSVGAPTVALVIKAVKAVAPVVS